MGEDLSDVYFEKGTSARLTAHHVLARTGFVPKPLENKQYLSNGTFQVERITGCSWEDLFNDSNVQPSVHLEICRTIVEQELVFKEMGYLVLDRSPENIMVSDQENLPMIERVKQVDLVSTVDLAMGKIVGTKQEFTTDDAEPMLVGEIASIVIRSDPNNSELLEKMKPFLNPFKSNRPNLEALQDALK